MENFKIEIKPLIARVNFGVRIAPQLKEELNCEAVERGQSSSEYGETILHNRHMNKAELEQLKLTLVECERTISTLNAQLKTVIEKLDAEATAHMKEIQELQATMEKLRAENEFFDNERLGYLLKHLKGKRDKVENAYGDNFDIIYDSPQSVLTSLIYSSKLNK